MFVVVGWWMAMTATTPRSTMQYSPQKAQPEESVDTYFPPTMPHRQKSLDVPDCWMMEEETCNDNDAHSSENEAPKSQDHWTIAEALEAAAPDIKTPPVQPMRLASDEPAGSTESSSELLLDDDEEPGNDDEEQ